MFKSVLAAAAVITAMTGEPSRAANFVARSDGASGSSWSDHTRGATGVLPDVGFAISPRPDSHLLAASLALSNISGLRSEAFYGLTTDAAHAGLLSVGAAGDAALNASRDVLSGFEMIESCSSADVICAGGGASEMKKAIDTIALLPPAAAGSAVKSAAGSIAQQTGSAIAMPSKPDLADHAPEPISLALLALGLLGITAGIRKYLH